MCVCVCVCVCVLSRTWLRARACVCVCVFPFFVAAAHIPNNNINNITIKTVIISVICARVFVCVWACVCVWGGGGYVCVCLHECVSAVSHLDDKLLHNVNHLEYFTFTTISFSHHRLHQQHRLAHLLPLAEEWDCGGSLRSDRPTTTQWQTQESR